MYHNKFVLFLKKKLYLNILILNSTDFVQFMKLLYEFNCCMPLKLEGPESEMVFVGIGNMELVHLSI